MVGQTLAHYKIVEELGRGGMGIVYRAEDTKLQRDVALKVLPQSALSSVEDRMRFFREARAAAAVTHPNIAVTHSVDEAVPEGGGENTERLPFIAMELIHGETLADICDGQTISIDQAVNFGIQIAKGLRAAHANNVVHRDIKPGNLMVDQEGHLKILDFGLAQMEGSTKLTRLGAKLGTVAYMSPEQSHGDVLDHQTDLWSLGVILYELLAGRNPFQAHYEQAVVYAILKLDPDPITDSRPEVPTELETIIFKLLKKDREDRYQSAQEIIDDLTRIQLDTVPLLTESTVFEPIESKPNNDSGSSTLDSGIDRLKSPLRLTVALGLVIGISLLLGWFVFRDVEPDRPVLRLSIHTPDVNVQRVFAISPDGTHIAISGQDTAEVNSGVFIYETSTGSNRYVEGSNRYTLNARFSPDSKSLALFGGVLGAAVVPSDGGSLVSITKELAVDGDWITNEEVVLNQVSRISKASVAGGPLETVSQDSGRVFVAWGLLHLLPNNEDLLVTTFPAGSTDPETGILDIKTNSYQTLLPNTSGAYFVKSGHLMFVEGDKRDGHIVVQPFSPSSQELSSSRLQLSLGVTNRNSYAVADNGTLVYREERAIARQYSMYWINLAGDRLSDVPIPPSNYVRPSISPDGTRMAVAHLDNTEGEHDIILYDLETGREMRLTFEHENLYPSWSPDGVWVYFSSVPGGMVLSRKRADGSGSTERVLLPVEPGDNPDGAQISQDGSRMALSLMSHDQGMRLNIHVVSPTDTTKHWIFEHSEAQWTPSISMDGRYVAFEMNDQIYVQEVETSSYWVVSDRDENASIPKWSADGNTIYYRAENLLRNVRVFTLPVFQSQNPQTVFDADGYFEYDLHPDGARILINAPDKEEDERAQNLNIVLNWDAELDGMIEGTGK